VLGIVFSALELNERPAGWEILGMTLIATAQLIDGPLAMGNVQWRRSPAPKF
jgi:hypothetical protein